MRSMRICFAILLSLSATSSLHADWTRTDTTTGGRITCLVQHGGFLFAGTYGAGLFRSSDNGANWTALTSGLPTVRITSLCSISGMLFAGTEGGGTRLFLSSNNGTTWIGASTGIPTNHWINALAAVIDSGRTNLFAGTSGAVYRTTNGGAIWTLSRTSTSSIRALGIVGTELFSGGSEGVYRTSNLGATWTRADSGMSTKYVSAFASIGSDLYATTFGGGAFKTTNSGVFWTPAGLTGGNIWAITSTGTTLYAGQAAGAVFRSTDGGANWVSLPVPVKWATTVLANGAQVFAGTASGLYASTNSGTNWTSAGLSSGVALAMAGDSKLYAGSYSGVCVTSNGGTDWSQAGLLIEWIRGLALSGNYMFAGIIGEGAHFSSNGGTTWIAGTGTLASTTANTFAVVPSGTGGITVYAGSWGTGVHVSSDSGKSWTQTGTGITPGDVRGLVVLGPAMLAGTYGGGVFVSTNNGVNWARQNASTAKVLSMGLSGNKVFAGTEGGGMLISADTGKSWTAAGLGGSMIRAIAVSGTKVFAGSETGVWLTTDNGAKWSMLNAGLADSSITSLCVNGTDLYAGVGTGGIWKRPLSELVVGVVDVSGQIPVAFGLSQNYPNPFNPSTTIRYGLSKRAQVTLTIFNALGQEVARLVNAEQDAGYHEVPFDASRLASGVYLYRLQAGSYVETRKLVLVR